MVEPVPNHQVVDLMLILLHIKVTGALVHRPITHGHIIITLVVTPKKRLSVEKAIEFFEAHSRIKVVETAKVFLYSEFDSTTTEKIGFHRLGNIQSYLNKRIEEDDEVKITTAPSG